jgi:hypothetical protein
VTWFSAIFDLVSAIPATFWGVVAGSFFALAGVILTNRANERRARTQLEHDREVRRNERELSLRKEIYLAAAEAASAGLRALGSMSNLDLSYDEILRPYLEAGPAIAKVHVVGNEETVRAVANVSGELQGAFTRLAAKRFPLMRGKQQIAALQQQIDNFAKQRDHILELMRDHNIEGNPDQRRFNVLKGNFDFNQQQVLDGIRQRDRAELALGREQINYAEECLAAQRPIASLLVPAIVAMRRDLELPMDEERYIGLMNELLAKQKKKCRPTYRRRTRVYRQVGGYFNPGRQLFQSRT